MLKKIKHGLTVESSFQTMFFCRAVYRMYKDCVICIVNFKITGPVCEGLICITSFFISRNRHDIFIHHSALM